MNEFSQRQQDYLDFDAIDPDDYLISREQWDVMLPDEQFDYLRRRENRDFELHKLLALIPACSVHGHECLPHAHDWVKARRMEAEHGE